MVSCFAYAWALHKNGRDAEALDYAREATSTGMRNALFSFHRGMIEAALGQNNAARTDLTGALAVNPHFNPLQVRSPVPNSPSWRPTMRTLRYLFAPLAAASALVLLTPALAHPLGNFTINHYDGLRLCPDRIDDLAVVDRAEIPTLQARDAIDTDHNGILAPAELQAYAAMPHPLSRRRPHHTVGAGTVRRRSRRPARGPRPDLGPAPPARPAARPQAAAACRRRRPAGPCGGDPTP
jgi:hypothetical protein